jgi:ribosomal protein L9
LKEKLKETLSEFGKEWENSYYGKHKELQRAKAKQEKSSEWKTSQEQREAIEEEVKQLKSEEPVTAQEISDTLKEKLKETLSEFGKVTDDDETEEDNFIEDIKYKYELMLEMFPHINIKNLQHVFLQLLTRDVEDSMMANNG